MSGGGGDKSRAGFASRVVVITETDGLDEVGGGSREADKVTQLEARTRAYGQRKRLYMECTVSTEEGRTWREYVAGTHSRIVLRCPHCQAWVCPEREHLAHWQEADSLAAARSAGRFVCPSCAHPWGEEDRRQANLGCRLLHDGQTLDEQGHVQGDSPPSDTFGFRWSAVHNLFLTAGDLAADEWRAARSHDEENAERALRQFVWCLPAAPLATRTAEWPRGVVPKGARHLTAAVDLGKYLCHWIVVAWLEGAGGHVVDYGRIEVASDDLGVEQAIMVSLRQFRQIAQAGWPQAEGEGTAKAPDSVWIERRLPDASGVRLPP